MKIISRGIDCSILIADNNHKDSKVYNLNDYIMNSEEIIEEIPIKHNNDDKSTIKDCEDDSALNKQIEKCCKRKTNFDERINELLKKLRYQMLNFGFIQICNVYKTH